MIDTDATVAHFLGAKVRDRTGPSICPALVLELGEMNATHLSQLALPTW